MAVAKIIQDESKQVSQLRKFLRTARITGEEKVRLALLAPPPSKMETKEEPVVNQPQHSSRELNLCGLVASLKDERTALGPGKQWQKRINALRKIGINSGMCVTKEMQEKLIQNTMFGREGGNALVEVRLALYVLSSGCLSACK